MNSPCIHTSTHIVGNLPSSAQFDCDSRPVRHDSDTSVVVREARETETTSDVEFPVGKTMMLNLPLARRCQ